MAISDTHFIEKDATANNDLGLYADAQAASYTSTLTPMHLTVMPNAVSAPVVVTLPGFTRSWTFGGCHFTKANYTTLIAVAKQSIVYNSTYPRLNVMDDPTPGWTTYPVKVTSVHDGPQGSDIINRKVTVTFEERGTSPYLFILDVGSVVGTAVTVILNTNESVQQALLFSEKRTTSVAAWDQHTQTKSGITPLTASLTGFVAKASIDNLQQLLQLQTTVGMELHGDVYDTQSGDGLYDTNLTAAKGYIRSLTTDVLWPGADLMHVSVEVAKAVNP